LANVVIPALLRPLCDNQTKITVPATTLNELFKALDEECPGFYDRVIEDGKLRPELAVAIDGEAEQFPLWEKLRPDAEVAIVPAIGGGRD
jgi:molybdopterin converting factor small subunit